MIYNTSFNNIEFNGVSDLLLKNKGSYTCTQIDNLNTLNNSMPKSIKLVLLDDIDNTGTDSAFYRKFINDIADLHNVVCTAAAYYPPTGYVSWHTNKNIKYYNAICTFSDTGDSYFEYRINSENDINRIYDNVGWSVKKTAWGTDPIIWHRAESNCNRITFTFSSPQEQAIDELIAAL